MSLSLLGPQIFSKFWFQQIKRLIFVQVCKVFYWLSLEGGNLIRASSGWLYHEEKIIREKMGNCCIFPKYQRWCFTPSPISQYRRIIGSIDDHSKSNLLIHSESLGPVYAQFEINQHAQKLRGMKKFQQILSTLKCEM